MKKKFPYSKLNASSKNLLVRPYRISDFRSCKEALQSMREKYPKSKDWIRISGSESKRIFSKNVKEYGEWGSAGNQFVFGVFHRKTGEHLGEVSLFTINRQLNWLNLGYHFHEQFQGKGYATEASRLALTLAFKKIGAHRVEAGTQKNNKASIRVAKKLGMRFEGIRKKFFAYQGGVDMLFFATNAIEYKKLMR